VLVVAGKFDPDETLGWIVKDFGSIPKPARTLPRLYTEEPVQDGERSVSLRRVGDTQLVGVLYHTVPGAHPDAIAVSALARIMTIEPGGRLYTALVEAKKGDRGAELHAGAARPRLRCASSHKLPMRDSLSGALATMEATLEGVRTSPITPAEVDRVRAKALRDFDERIADPARLGIALSESVRSRLASRVPRPRPLARGYRWRRAACRRSLSQTVESHGRHLRSRHESDRAPRPPPVDLAAMVKDYKGDPAAATGEVFDATPANLDARTQRFALQNGMKVALLPKKTRGATSSSASR
jgi:zinc protease